MNVKFTNYAKSTLLVGISAIDVSLTVAAGDGAKFPVLTAGQYFYATLIIVASNTKEIVKVTARSGDVFTIVRGQDDTTGQIFATGDLVQLRLNAAALQLFTGLESNIFTGFQDWARETVAATATTTPLWVAVNTQDWTGTPTITNFPAANQAGAFRTVYPAAGTIITNNANIAVQGAGNYTVVAGDRLDIEALTTTTFKVFISKKDGSPIIPQNVTYTTGGSSTAYTLTPTPALAALGTGHRYTVAFNATAGATPTLAISGLTAKALKVYDSAGAKTAASATTIVSGMISDVIYDGTDYIVMTPARASGGGITQGTAVASTSGASIDFTGIPSGTKRVVVSLSGVSTTGTSNPIVQLGTGGSPETTGYLGSTTIVTTSGVSANFTNGVGLNGATVAATVLHAVAILTLVNASSNTWVATVVGGRTTDIAAGISGGSSKSLAGVLNMIRITTVAGSDTFDAGTINIQYE